MSTRDVLLAVVNEGWYVVLVAYTECSIVRPVATVQVCWSCKGGYTAERRVLSCIVAVSIALCGEVV